MVRQIQKNKPAKAAVHQTPSPKVNNKAVIVKTKYPNFRARLQVSSTSYKRQNSQSNNLKDLVNQICDAELRNISTWLDENPKIKRELERKDVINSMTSILHALPKEVAAKTPQDMKFFPELPSSERTHVKILSEQLQQLVDLKNNLKSTFQDIESSDLGSADVSV